MQSLEQLIRERPSFHEPETEISRTFDARESLLTRERAEAIAHGGLTCYGIGSDVLSYIAATVDSSSRTLETGAGCSTLVFAMRGAQHVAVTPSAAEIGRIRSYAETRTIPMTSVCFEQHPSDEYLPRSDLSDLDLVLLDGKHAFPWPIVDWFFTADRLRKGGLMIVDDAHMKSVSMLGDFMAVDPGWKLERDFGGRTLVFRKMRDSIHDVAWHMQPYTVEPVAGRRRSTWLGRFLGRP